MLITRFSFGKIIIDNIKYQSDLVIFNNELADSHWWRKEGHNLQLDDVERYLSPEIKVLLIGRGFSSRMQIDKDLQIFLLESNIVLQALSTPEACKRYNEMNHDDLLAFFHLTC